MNKKIIGVQFNTKSKKNKNKNYYYYTDKEVKTNSKILVPTNNNLKTPSIVSNSDYKGKLSKNRKYKTY